MKPAEPLQDTVHATCVAWNGEAVLLIGPSGAGKSDLALRLMDRGWRLVSDDYTIVSQQDGGGLIATAPTTIAGQMEVRGIGIVAVDSLANAPVALALDLTPMVERMPDRVLTRRIAGVDLPLMALNPFESSAPIKVEMMLRQVRVGDIS